MQKHAQGKTCTGIEASPNRSISEGSLLSIHPGKIPSALLVDKGGFYESTSGQWIYVLEKDKKSATKKAIKIGRQNPDFYEIKEGLSDGEEVVISSYQTLGDYDKIIFK